MLTSLLQPECTTSNRRVTAQPDSSAHFAWQHEDTRQVLSIDAQLTSHTKISPTAVISCVIMRPPPCLRIYVPNKSKTDLQYKTHCDLCLWTNTSGGTEGTQPTLHLTHHLQRKMKSHEALHLYPNSVHAFEHKHFVFLPLLFQLRQIKLVLL